MLRRLLAGVLVSAALSLAAACGGSSPASSTPTPTPSQTAATEAPTPIVAISHTATVTVSPTPPPAGSICAAADLYGAFVLSQGAAGTSYHQLGLTNTGDQDCILVNPPTLRFKDASGLDLGVTYTSSDVCPGQGPYDQSCIDEDAVDLPPGQPTPATDAPPGQLSVTVAVTNIGVLQPCASPTVQAHFIGLRFTGTTEDVNIELPNDIDLQTCSGQVRLQGYGPSS